MDAPRCSGTLTSGKSKGKPCTRPAGWQTDHPGIGPCLYHGGGDSMWLASDEQEQVEVVVRSALFDKVEAMREDPDLFDGRRELALARALLEKAVEKVEETDYQSPMALQEVRQWIALLLSGQEKVIKSLVSRDYFMTAGAVLLVLKQTGDIWHQEMQKVLDASPELAEMLKDIETRVASRLRHELILPEVTGQ